MLLPPNARRPVLQCLLAIHEASSLPVPDSPIGSTRASEPAAMEVCSTARSHAGLEPIIREGASLMSSRRRFVFPAQGRLLQRVLQNYQHANRD